MQLFHLDQSSIFIGIFLFIGAKFVENNLRKYCSQPKLEIPQSSVINPNAKQELMKGFERADTFSLGEIKFDKTNMFIILNSRTNIGYELPESITNSLSKDEIKECMIEYHAKMLSEESYRK